MENPEPFLGPIRLQIRESGPTWAKARARAQRREYSENPCLLADFEKQAAEKADADEPQHGPPP